MNKAIYPIAAVLLFGAAETYNLARPAAAVGGAYGLLSAPDTPGTPPAPAGGCVDGCTCGGTGKERSGDGILVFDCRCPDDCKCKQSKEEPAKEEPPKEEPAKEEPPKEEPAKKTVTRKLYRMPGSRWNWEGLNSPSESFMRSHLLSDHGVNASGWSREAMQVAHDNLHNGYDVWGEEPSTSGGNFRSDCPSGNCPTSTSGGNFRSDCPSGNCPTSSSPSRRGLFGRRR